MWNNFKRDFFLRHTVTSKTLSAELELAQSARDDVELAAYVVDGTSDGRWSVNHRHSLRVRVIGQLERTRYRTREFSTAISSTVFGE